MIFVRYGDSYVPVGCSSCFTIYTAAQVDATAAQMLNRFGLTEDAEKMTGAIALRLTLLPNSHYVACRTGMREYIRELFKEGAWSRFKLWLHAKRNPRSAELHHIGF